MESVVVDPVAGSSEGLQPFARGPVLGIAAGTVLLLLAVSWRYGYHRDELYFLEASRHLAFGYVDQPPGAVLVAWIDRVLLGNTLVGLRLIPALVDGVVVAMTGLMARELGGRRFAQYFAALCVALSGFLVIGHLEGPTIYDALSWALVSFLVMRILRTGNARLWLAVGLTVGVGVEFKESILFLCGALIIGLRRQPAGARAAEPVVVGRRRDRPPAVGPEPDLGGDAPLARLRDGREPAGRALGPQATRSSSRSSRSWRWARWSRPSGWRAGGRCCAGVAPPLPELRDRVRVPVRGAVALHPRPLLLHGAAVHGHVRGRARS